MVSDARPIIGARQEVKCRDRSVRLPPGPRMRSPCSPCGRPRPQFRLPAAVHHRPEAASADRVCPSPLPCPGHMWWDCTVSSNCSDCTTSTEGTLRFNVPEGALLFTVP